MSQSFEWFDKLTTAAESTDEGRLFKAAGFDLHHTGGGCTAWRRAAVDGYHILVTDSTGTDHRLGDSYVIDAAHPDRWLIGLHLDDGDHLESSDAATVVEAIEAAGRLDEAARRFSPDGDQLVPSSPKTSAATIAAMLSELIETHMLKCDEAFPHPVDCPAHVISEVHKTAAWIQSIRTSGTGAGHLIELSLDDDTSFHIRVEEA